MAPLEYNLPDAPLFKKGSSPGSVIWKPGGTSIVLGNSNRPEHSLDLEQVASDNIPVYKRPSGGQAVLLSPKTLVISVVYMRDRLENAMKYFRLFNQKIIHSLEGVGIRNLQQRGISDIAIGQKKILGSAIYQDKDKVFYHAVLNVAESTEVIEKYIKHPPREPDYRRGRLHRDFVTSLHREGYKLEIETLKHTIQEEFEKKEKIH